MTQSKDLRFLPSRSSWIRQLLRRRLDGQSRRRRVRLDGQSRRRRQRLDGQSRVCPDGQSRRRRQRLDG